MTGAGSWRRNGADMVRGDSLVFVLLGMAFAAVGVHLFFYSRRRASLVRDFARSRGYSWQARDDGSLEADLQRSFRLEQSGCVRAFDRPRDIVSVPGGTLFPAIELLDLNPYASVYDSHHARVAIALPDAPPWEGIFLVMPDMEIRQRFPLDGPRNEARTLALLEQEQVPPPPRPLSITFMRGRGLAYLRPTVVGSVDRSDLAYLADLADRLSRR